MYIAKITIDYDNMTIDYININCTDNENIVEIILPLFTIIPCGMSLISLISLMVYTLIKPLFKKRRLRKVYTRIIQLDLLLQAHQNAVNQFF